MTRPGLCTPVIASASWSPLRSPNGAVEEDGARWRPQRLTCCLLPAPVSFIQASSLGFNSSFSGLWALETTPLASLRCTCRSQHALLRPLSPVHRTPSRFWFKPQFVPIVSWVWGLVSLHIAYGLYSLFVFLAFQPLQQIPFITLPVDVSGMFSVLPAGRFWWILTGILVLAKSILKFFPEILLLTLWNCAYLNFRRWLNCFCNISSIVRTIKIYVTAMHMLIMNRCSLSWGWVFSILVGIYKDGGRDIICSDMTLKWKSSWILFLIYIPDLASSRQLLN